MIKLKKLKLDTRQERFKWRVDGNSDWEEYQEAVLDEFKDWETWIEAIRKDREGGELVEAVWEEWKKRVITAAERGIGKKRVNCLSKGWWSEDVLDAIKDRRDICRKLRQARRSGNRNHAEVSKLWEVYRLKRKGVKKIIRNEKRQNRKKVLQKIWEQGGPSCKLFWSDLKGRKGRQKVMRMKSSSGVVVEEPDEILDVLAQHWEELGKAQMEGSAVELGGVELESREDVSDMCQEVSWHEVVGVLKQLKRGKAPGPDGILNEMLIYGGTRVECLVSILNVVRVTKQCPNDWRRSFVVPRFKDGDPEVVGNYRGIALGSCVAKVWTRILTGRLGEYAEERILTEAQGGFRAKRRCADQVLILRGVCELRKRKKKGTWLGFMDVSKAYDTVWRGGLWEKLRMYGVEEEFVRWCEALYNGVEGSVLMGNEQSRWFSVEEGLRQGCPLSPLLYSIYVMGMVEELEKEGIGVVLTVCMSQILH